MCTWFKKVFQWHMLYHKVAVKVTTAKEVEGNPSELLDDGLFMNLTVVQAVIRLL